MTRARALVIGAGIGGLAAAAGLCSDGWDVSVCERAESLEPVGAGLALAPNGLRALDAVAPGHALRALAVQQELGIRRSDGRWLIRSATGQMVSERFGDPVIVLPRATVIDALAARIPDGVLSLATEVTSVETVGKAEPGRAVAVRVTTTAGDLDADLLRPMGVNPRPSGCSRSPRGFAARRYSPGRMNLRMRSTN